MFKRMFCQDRWDDERIKIEINDLYDKIRDLDLRTDDLKYKLKCTDMEWALKQFAHQSATALDQVYRKLQSFVDAGIGLQALNDRLDSLTGRVANELSLRERWEQEIERRLEALENLSQDDE